MKKLLLLFFTILYFNLFGVVEETASFVGFMYGDAPECAYDDWETHIVEKISSPGYNAYAPFDVQTTGFGSFVEASTTQLFDWNAIVELFLSGDYEATQAAIDEQGWPYDVVIFNDTDTDRVYYMLRERINLMYVDDNNTPTYEDDDENGAFDYGWGLYIYCPEATMPIIVTTPHPTDDYPTTVISVKAFVDFNAKFLLVSGAGREVLWNQEGYYSNSKSLSDPTRNLNHPFNKCYSQFCDLIREEFGQRELSVQIHSYDWGNSHPGYANTQISAGWSLGNPGIPIRDLSSRKIDLIQNSDPVIFPANSIGIHPEVTLNDYYAVVYNEHGFVYDNGEVSFDVNNHYDLWGYRYNRQMQYTKVGWSDNDTFEAFFHIEVDELPNCYPQTIANYHWFYGWDPVNLQWDMEKTYDKTFDYYSYWIDRMVEVLPEVIGLDDQLVPDTPTNFEVVTEANSYVKLSWDRMDCFDFETYEIFVGTEPIDNGNYYTIDRDDIDALACMATSSVYIQALEPSTQYYFKIRAIDKNNNYSELSDEETGFSTPNVITNFKAIGEDAQAKITWRADLQNELFGFNVYRIFNDEMVQVGDMLPSTNQNYQQYEFVDVGLDNGVAYQYQIEFVTFDGDTYLYGEVVEIVPSKIYRLEFMLNNDYSAVVEFGENEYASDLYDTDYDYPTDDDAEENYLLAYLAEPTWEGDPYNDPTKYSREIYGTFEETTEMKYWSVKFRTDQLEEPITVSIQNPDRDCERMYLRYEGEYYDLFDGSFQFIPGGEYNQSFDLYWGNLLPDVNIAQIPREIIYPNTNIQFNWNLTHVDVVQHLDLLVKNDDVEIMVASQLNPNAVSVDWVIPEMSLENLKFVVRMTMNEGDVVEVESDETFAIETPESFFISNIGWNLISNPFINIDGLTDDIYGENSLFYQLIGLDFYESTNVEYGQSYWQYATEEHLFGLENGVYENSDFSITLVEGWNIIPNPFIVDCDINDLNFNYNGANFDYNEAIQYELIQPFFYSYEEGCFVPEAIMQPQKSYYIYSYLADVEIDFELYYDNDIDTDLTANWKMQLTAENNADKSSVIVGTSNVCSADYDLFYDLLKPNLKPMEEQISLVLEEDFIGQDLHQSITSEITEEDEIYYWNVRLNTESLETVDFNVNFENIPENLNAFIIIADAQYQLLEDGIISFEPSEMETYFQIKISDALANNDEDLIAPKLSLSNYPNPFNPTTTISFSIPESSENTEIVIYNVKGQKVKRLLYEKISAGEHKVVWNGKDDNGKQVSSGVYFCKLSQENKLIKARKMLLLK